MRPIDPPSPPLQVGKVLLGAVVLPWLQRRRFVPVLLYPALLFLAARSVSVLSQWQQVGTPVMIWLPLLAYAAAFVLFAVRCHRLVLVPDASAQAQLGLIWTRIDTRFALMALALIAIHAVIMLILAGPIVALAQGRSVEDWLALPAQATAAYVTARLCLVLPARALDRSVDLAWAWRASRGNGWRLVAVVIIWPWFLGYVLPLLYRDDATFIEWAALTLLTVVTATVQVSALSLAFRELAGGAADEPERPEASDAGGPPAPATAAWSSRRLLLLGAALGVAALALLPSLLKTASSVSQTCTGPILAREESPDGRLVIDVWQMTCDDDLGPRLRLQLSQTGGSKYTVLLHEQDAVGIGPENWRTQVGWTWVANDRLDVLVPTGATALARPPVQQWNGAQVRYRPLLAPIPDRTPPTGR